MKITPFLHAANKFMDYTPVAAAPGAAKYLLHARTDDNEKIPGIVRREVHGPDGKLTFFSISRRAGDDYRDGYGRHIMRTDGICVSDDQEGKFVFHPYYLDAATEINDGYFEKFWTRTDPSEGVANVSDEINFRPDLPEQAEGITVLEPYEEQKKNERPATETDFSTRGEGGGNADRATGGESGQDISEIRQAGGKRSKGSTVLQSAAAVGIGAVGLGLVAHGIVKSFKPDRPRDKRDQPPSRWKKPLTLLAELGLGAGLTWAAYVHATRGSQTKSR
jgi:hypothetical protein